MLNPKNTWNRQFKDLSDKAKNITSQYGENGLIEAIFSVCNPQNKWCVEFGASDGYTFSNTYPLIQKGWQSIQIEAILETYKDGKLFSGFKKLRETYKDNPKVICLHKKIEKNNLEEILVKYSVPYNLDFLSIDIDSYDAEVWMNLKEYQPNLICIECNDEIEDFNRTYYNIGNPHNAASIGFLNWIANGKGYDFICATRCNAFYIEREFAKPLYA